MGIINSMRHLHYTYNQNISYIKIYAEFVEAQEGKKKLWYMVKIQIKEHETTETNIFRQTHDKFTFKLLTFY
jgi:hypothetical protein